MAEYQDFERELKLLMERTSQSVAEILLSEGRIAKHEPWTWMDEPEDEHLHKALRHILTYQLIRDGQAPIDGEDHLNNALTRLVMANAIAKRK